MIQICVRPAVAADAQVIAVIHRLSFNLALPHLADRHSPLEDLSFFRDQVLPQQTVWVAEGARQVAGFAATQGEWLHHLYVHPGHQGQGVGKALLNQVRTTAPRLHLWTFQANGPARAFYERHGFEAVKFTDGSRNEERDPDVLYVWSAQERV